MVCPQQIFGNVWKCFWGHITSWVGWRGQHWHLAERKEAALHPTRHQPPRSKEGSGSDVSSAEAGKFCSGGEECLVQHIRNVIVTVVAVILLCSCSLSEQWSCLLILLRRKFILTFWSVTQEYKVHTLVETLCVCAFITRWGETRRKPMGCMPQLSTSQGKL